LRINHTVPHTLLMIGAQRCCGVQGPCAPIINKVCGTVWLMRR